MNFWQMMLGSVVRTAVASASGYAVATGKMDATDVQTLLGAAGALGTLAWSIVQKKKVAAL